MGWALNEGNWLPVAMALSSVAAAGLVLRARALDRRSTILCALNVFYGCTIGTMAFGHLSAVTIKLGQGTLNASPLFLYPLGVLLLVPAWRLVIVAAGITADRRLRETQFWALNAWLGVALLALGLHNLPLAVPAALNLGYQFHTRRMVGWTIVTIAVVGNLALFVGALVFMASGQTFEQFRGLE